MPVKTKSPYFYIVLVMAIALILVAAVSKNNNGVSPLSQILLDHSNDYPTYLPYKSSSYEILKIDLPNLSIDPENYVTLKGSGFLNEYSPNTNRLYIVQYKETPSHEMYTKLKPVRTFKDNVFILVAQSKDLKDMMKDNNVNFIDHYHPHYKLGQSLVSAYYSLGINPDTKIVVTFSPFSDQAVVQSIVNSATARIVESTQNANGYLYIVDGIDDRQKLFTLAINPLVSEIHLVN